MEKKPGEGGLPSRIIAERIAAANEWRAKYRSKPAIRRDLSVSGETIEFAAWLEDYDAMTSIDEESLKESRQEDIHVDLYDMNTAELDAIIMRVYRENDLLTVAGIKRIVSQEIERSVGISRVYATIGKHLEVDSARRTAVKYAKPGETRRRQNA